MKLFVYGTLKRGYNMERIAPNARYIDSAVLYGYRIYNLGSYPAIYPGEEDEDFVYGEVWEVPEEEVTNLDRYEGGAYVRVRVDVVIATPNDSDPLEIVTANTYLYRDDPSTFGIYLPNGSWNR